MILRHALSVALVMLLAGRALADDESAERAFRAIVERAAANDPGALAAFEALGAERPVTRWTDNAWAEAAVLAERRGDYARARAALEQVIAVGTDAALVRRARTSLARLEGMTGDGRWDAVARDHQRLAGEVFGGGDPQAALATLEQLVRGAPQYPRAADAWLVLAQGWEREGEGDRAMALLREGINAMDPARARDRARLGMAFARTAIRRGALDDAEAELARLAAAPGADRSAIADVEARLTVARRRAWTRRGVLLAIVGALAAAAVVLRRDTGSWRAAIRRLARPPVEVIFLMPVGAVLAIVGQTGNPLVAKALLAIMIAGLAVAWLSGALLEARRTRHGRLGAPRAFGQAVVAVAVVAAATYLAVDRDRMLDLVEETVEHGPIPR